jgi:hypothetical protein
MLNSTNRKWTFDKTGADSNKTIILPMYFYFADRCDPSKPNAIHYNSVPPVEGKTTIEGKGYTVLRVEKDNVILLPIKLKGDMIFRDYFKDLPPQ